MVERETKSRFGSAAESVAKRLPGIRELPALSLLSKTYKGRLREITNRPQVREVIDSLHNAGKVVKARLDGDKLVLYTATSIGLIGAIAGAVRVYRRRKRQKDEQKEKVSAS